MTAEETKLTLNFVKNLVNMMTSEELELRNADLNTSFYMASGLGHLRYAKIMLEKNPSLQYIRGNLQYLPLTASASEGRYNVVGYLYISSNKMASEQWNDTDRKYTLIHCVQCDFFDVALQIVDDFPELAVNISLNLLEILAKKSDAINPVQKKSMITRFIESISRFFGTKIHRVVDVAEEDTDALKLLKLVWRHTSRTKYADEYQQMFKWQKPLLVAAEMGNTRFVAELLRTYPDLTMVVNEDDHTIFHIAVINRRQGVYNLLYEMGMMRHGVFIIEDNMGNNMLHLVGKSSKKMEAKTSSASLLMQRELLWFKEIEKMATPIMREAKNKDGHTPYELFSRENKDLVSKGVDWIKDSMVVATLIITVAFAVAFTVPGGYNQDTGIPIFNGGTSFIVFVIADSISLVSSSTSLLVFLSILTSRHSQLDFLYSLPKKLMIGLIALFISVATMMVTFSASFFVLYHKGLKWIPILIAAFVSMPVIMFAILQFPLLVDMYRSMYDSHYLFKPKKRLLYNINPRLRSNNFRGLWFPCKSFIRRIFFKRA